MQNQIKGKTIVVNPEDGGVLNPLFIEKPLMSEDELKLEFLMKIDAHIAGIELAISYIFYQQWAVKPLSEKKRRYLHNRSMALWDSWSKAYFNRDRSYDFLGELQREILNFLPSDETFSRELRETLNKMLNDDVSGSDEDNLENSFDEETLRDIADYEARIRLLECYDCCQQGVRVLGSAFLLKIKNDYPEVTESLISDIDVYGTVHKVTHKQYERIYVVVKHLLKARTALQVLITHTNFICDEIVARLKSVNGLSSRETETSTPSPEIPLVDYQGMISYCDRLRVIFGDETDRRIDLIESDMNEENMVRMVDKKFYDLSTALEFCQRKSRVK